MSFLDIEDCEEKSQTQVLRRIFIFFLILHDCNIRPPGQDGKKMWRGFEVFLAFLQNFTFKDVKNYSIYYEGGC